MKYSKDWFESYFKLSSVEYMKFALPFLMIWL